MYLYFAHHLLHMYLHKYLLSTYSTNNVHTASSFLFYWKNCDCEVFLYMAISIFICWMASLCLLIVNSNVSLSMVLIGSNSSPLSSEWSPSFLRIGSRKWSNGFATNSIPNVRKAKIAPPTRITKAAIQPVTKVIHPKYSSFSI